MTTDGPDLLDHLADMDAATDRATTAMDGADNAVTAIRAAAESYAADAGALKREGADDWALFYSTVARELTKVAAALTNPPRKDARP